MNNNNDTSQDHASNSEINVSRTNDNTEINGKQISDHVTRTDNEQQHFRKPLINKRMNVVPVEGLRRGKRLKSFPFSRRKKWKRELRKRKIMVSMGKNK